MQVPQNLAQVYQLNLTPDWNLDLKLKWRVHHRFHLCKVNHQSKHSKVKHDKQIMNGTEDDN